MLVSEITSYKALLKFIKYQISLQSMEGRVIRLSLPENWFFKMLILIRFYLKDSSPLDNTITRFNVRINGYLTKVEKK